VAEIPEPLMLRRLVLDKPSISHQGSPRCCRGEPMAFPDTAPFPA
jgi:hypothetical protein